MTARPTARVIKIVVSLTLALVLGAALGCSKPATPKPVVPAALTAQQAFAIAKTSLATVAPDAKLLVVQSANIITATSTPEWQFLIGSAKDDTVYAVVMKNGKANPSRYGSANLSAQEWAAVPPADAWKIDSPEAYAKALAAFPSASKSTRYTLGFVTYIPRASTNARATPMTWMVTFDPAAMKNTDTTSTIEVNATTGVTTVPK